MLNKVCLFSASKERVSAVITVSSRLYSQEIREIRNPDTAFLKKGTGGRSSFNGNVVTVFGASGFLGRFVCNQLGKRGCQIIIPHRSDPDDYTVKKLKLVGDLGQVLFQPFDLRDPLSIRKAIKYSNVVINLIGRDFETKNFSYEAVHVKGAKEIAKACREFNIERLIHFSALNVTENPEKFYLKKLQFLPSKLRGEHAVLDEFPTATIFRPGAVYGMFDRFVWPLACGERAFDYSIPLYAKGTKTIRQPVFAPDVALGVIAAMNDYDTRGKIIQAVGPERFYLRDIAFFIAQILQRQVVQEKAPLVHDIKYDIFFILKVLYYHYYRGLYWHDPKSLSFEQIERESVTDVVDRNLLTLEDLGISLAKMEDKIPHLIMKLFLVQNDFTRDYDEYEPAESLSAKALNDFA